MIIKLFIRNALDATKLHAHFQKFSGVTPPNPPRARGSAHCALHKAAVPLIPNAIQNRSRTIPILILHYSYPTPISVCTHRYYTGFILECIGNASGWHGSSGSIRQRDPIVFDCQKQSGQRCRIISS